MTNPRQSPQRGGNTRNERKAMRDREIKFRGWNRQTRKMIDLEAFTPLALNADIPGIFLPYTNQVDLMQYTGTRDVNDREIYEGDYVLIKRWGNPNCQDQEFITLVEWYRDGFSFYSTFPGGGGSHTYGVDYKSNYYPSNTIEIIGNVYQNEDLRLTQKVTHP